MPPGVQSAATGLRAEALLQILEVTRKLAAPFDLPAVLAEIGEAARSVLQAERATVWLYEAEQGALVLTGTPPNVAPVRAQLSQGVLGLTARSRQIINVPDVRREPLFDPAVDLDLNNDVRCMLSVPLVERSQLVGVLQVVDREGYAAFTTEDERIAETLATQCVVFIQRERMSRSLLQAEKLDREIKLAREIQMSTLPSEMPRLADYDMAGQFCPADQTGGDTFDLVPLDGDRLFVLLGDASGPRHRPGAERHADDGHAARGAAARRGPRRDLRAGQQPAGRGPARGALRHGILRRARHATPIRAYHAAGQGPLLHFQAATGECRWLTPTTFPMGFMRYPQIDPPQQLQLEPGDILGLISDGVFECENPAGRDVRDRGRRARAARRRHDRLDVGPARAHAAGRARLRRRASAGRRHHDRAARPARRDRWTHDGAAVFPAQLRFARRHLPLHRRFPRRRARSTGNCTRPVCFIVEELFTNFVKYNEGGRHDISLSLGHTPEQLTVRMTDFDVDAFDPTRAPAVDVDKPLGERQPGGLGLHLVRQMADTLQYEYAERRSTITFTKALEPG